MITLGEAELEIFSSFLVQVSSDLQRYPLVCTTTKIIFNILFNVLFDNFMKHGGTAAVCGMPHAN